MAELQPEKYRHDLEVVRNTASQVIKDFDMIGVHITFSGNPETAYNELLLQVTPALAEIYKNNQTTFRALLYRIDVDEKKFKTLESSLKGEVFHNKLAELVIEREFLKVLIRKLFTGQNG